MKKYLMAISAVGTFAMAGGDLAPVPVPIPVAEETGGWYAGAGFNYNRTYVHDPKWFQRTDTQDDTFGLTGIVGYSFNDYIAVEGRIATSIYEQDYADVLSYGIYLKPQYPVTEDFSIYALLGVAKTKVTGTVEGGDYYGIYPDEDGQTLISVTTFSWGIGVQYAWSDEWSVMFDYVSWNKDTTMDPKRLLYSYAGRPGGPYDKLSNDTLTLSVIYSF